jgi:hypothetical protein
MGAAEFHLESLEARRLLSGVTLVTHGWQGDSSDLPDWVTTMGGAIAQRAGADTAIYLLKIQRTAQADLYNVSLDLIEGDAAGSSDGAVVILLDWADASGVFFSYTSTTDIASFVAPYFFITDPANGIDHPWAELPIHLIGHSRGGSVVSELAWELGKAGVWIDELSTLDPRPVIDDANVQPPENVLLADNYYQTDGLITGVPVAGAANYDLSGTTWADHGAVHDFYQATITHPGSGGFDLSRISGGDRPSIGVGADYGGSATRYSLSRSRAQWPNIADIAILDSSTDFLVGETIPVDYFYQDYDSQMAVTWFLDVDQNPYNENSQQVREYLHGATGNQVSIGQSDLPTADLDAGNYYIYAMVEDGDGYTRFAYADSRVRLVNAAPTIGSLSHAPDRVIRGSAITLTANNVNDANPQQALTVVFYYDANRNGAWDSGDLEIGRDQTASDGWSFAGLTTNLPVGLNQFFAVAWDGSKQSTPAKTTFVVAVPDAYEQNDLSAAVNLRAPGVNSPNLSTLSGRKIIGGLNTLDDDQDWYKFSMKARGTAANTIKINFTNSSGDLDLYLYRGSRLVKKSATQRNVESISLAGLAKGAYFILVFGYRGAANPHYKLTIDPPRVSRTTRSRPATAQVGNGRMRQVEKTSDLTRLLNSSRTIHKNWWMRQ